MSSPDFHFTGFPAFEEHAPRCHLSKEEDRRRRSARSLSSFNTDSWSRETEPMSNTTTTHEMKKKQKRRFLIFTNVLMKFLEKKNPNVCQDARAVIRECKEKKSRGESGFESLSESVRVPLKNAVGPSYWKEAKLYMDEMEVAEFEPLSLDEAHQELGKRDLELLRNIFDNDENENRSMDIILSDGSTFKKNPLKEERRLRRKRFWMLIRVLMKYMEHQDMRMFLKARATIHDCVQRHQRREKNYKKLIECVKRELKKLVGLRNWRLAEAYLTKILFKKAEEEANDLLLIQEGLGLSYYNPNEDFRMSLIQQH
jgi:hypothetical protein